MKSYRKWLVVLSVVMIIAQAFLFDFNDFSFTTNASNYLGIISMVFVILSVILSQKHENNSP